MDPRDNIAAAMDIPGSVCTASLFGAPMCDVAVQSRSFSEQHVHISQVERMLEESKSLTADRVTAKLLETCESKLENVLNGCSEKSEALEQHWQDKVQSLEAAFAASALL